MERPSKTRDDDYQNRPGSDKDQDQAAAGGDQRQKKKKHVRHTPQQIQELEALFKITPLPDEEQRYLLGKKIGLEEDNVKFWFQNKRIILKGQQERYGNMVLRRENDKLRVENYMIKKVIENGTCNKCASTPICDMNQLKIENDRLNGELNRLYTALASSSPVEALPTPNSSAIVRNEVGSSSNSNTPPLLPMGKEVLDTPLPTLPRTSSPMGSVMGNGVELNRSMLVDLALAASDELIKMAQLDNPLWVKISDGRKEVLNYEEYARICSPYIGPIPAGYRSEASREIGIVKLNGVFFVETMLNADRWPEMFPSMIAKAVTVDVISSGMGGSKNGALIMMHGEVQLASPLVPVREWNILRFCKQHAQGVWVVVDVSVDNSLKSYKRLPSGCVVQEISNDMSKITWVDHSQYDESAVHQLYRPLVNSGIGFGAQRWIASLQRQCEFFSAFMSSSIPSEDTSGICQEGRRSMLELAQRMTNYFLSGICASSSSDSKWDIIHIGNNDTRFMSRKHVDNPGEASGNVISVATSVWMPVSRGILFEFLRDVQYRGLWNMFSNDASKQEILHLSKGQGQGNCVSILGDDNNAWNADVESNLLLVQDSWTDASGSMIVYSPITVESFNVVVNGGDSEYVPLLPSGFAIHPYRARISADGSSSSSGGSNDGGGDGGGGCLLTFGSQMMLLDNNLTMEFVNHVNGLITTTIQKINDALRVA